MRRAAISAGFSYVQSALALIAGIVLLPFIFRRLDASQFGAWLAALELVGFASLLDVGVLGTLPWLVAAKDGQGRRGGIRRLTRDSIVIGVVTGLAYTVAGVGLLHAMPQIAPNAMPFLDVLRGPLLLVILATGVNFPLRAFPAVLAGLQDAVFLGYIGVLQGVATIVLSLGLLDAGFGIYALATALVLPPLVTSLASCGRLAWILPGFISKSPRLRIISLKSLLQDGSGAWMSQAGWRLTAASTSIVLLQVGQPIWVVIYTCTAKACTILMPLVWQLTDSGLVGLAQLHAEGKAIRVREVVVVMTRVGLCLAGVAATGVLIVNPWFVGVWVGADKFGGIGLNAVIAGCLIGYSLGHTLLGAAAAIGQRTEVGVISLLQGIVGLASAAALGHWFGLVGVAASGLVSTLLVVLPFGGKVINRAASLQPRELWSRVFIPWLAWSVPLFAGATVLGWIVLWYPVIWLPLSLMFGAIVSWYSVRHMFAGVVLPGRVGRIAQSLRLQASSSATV